MSSPFPGMDPYLENPEVWPDLHHEMISQIRAALCAKVGPKYVVRVEVRVYLSDEEGWEQRRRIPDVSVYRPPTNGGGGASQSAVATEITPALLVQTQFAEEIEEPRLEIVEVGSKKLVTVIEILSPTNKEHGKRGRDEFLKKRREVMDSPSHWVEIDLLRSGTPPFTRDRLPKCDYLIHVSAALQRPRGRVWPFLLADPLPTISIPLLEGDEDAPLCLGEALRLSYDIARYDLTIDYKADPIPPLALEDAAWADALLKSKGLR